MSAQRKRLLSVTCGWCGKENLIRPSVPHARCFFCEHEWSPWPPDALFDEGCECGHAGPVHEPDAIDHACGAGACSECDCLVFRPTKGLA